MGRHRAYRPALVLITGVAAVGTLVALSGLRRQQDPALRPAGDGADGADVPVGLTPSGGRR